MARLSRSRTAASPRKLAGEFAFAAIVASLLFWIALGLLAGFFQQRMANAPMQEARRRKQGGCSFPLAGGRMGWGSSISELLWCKHSTPTPALLRSRGREQN